MQSAGAKGEPTAHAPGSELRRARAGPWYVQPALEARRLAFACAAATLALGGCASTKKQDENEKAGNYQVEVVSANFPAKQKLAQSSRLVIRVRNAGNATVPDIAMTVNGFSKRRKGPDLADPERPQFVINGRPKSLGGQPEAKEQTPVGCETAYVNTWACGKLKAGAEKTFEWNVTAVQAGAYKISYRVAAGLDGKAKAVAGGGGILSGSFAGTVADKPPDTRVADDGKTVVRGTR
jgi:hypothetical protein